MGAVKFQNIFSSQEPQERLISFLKNKESKKVILNGLYASSKAYAAADAIESLNKGIHIIVLSTKEEAQFFSNDLYNIIGEERVFYFPSSSYQSSRISTIKDSSQKVQRSAAISALTKYNNGEFEGKFILLVTYPGAVYEKIINKKSLKENLLKINVNDSLSH